MASQSIDHWEKVKRQTNNIKGSPNGEPFIIKSIFITQKRVSYFEFIALIR